MQKMLLLCFCLILTLFKSDVAATQFPLQASFTVDTVWATAYQVTVSLTNTSDQPTADWTATFSLPQGNTLSSYLYSGNFTTSGQNVTVTNLSSNASISPQASTTFSMIINMPQAGATTIDNLLASANGSSTPSTTVPSSTSSFALNASYKVDTVWATAFQATVTLTNNASVATSNWTATFTLPKNYVLSSHYSNGMFTTSGQNVTVQNLSTNGVIQPGGNATFSMIINMPKSAKPVINNLLATANSSTAPSPSPIPSAPVLTLISNSSTSYTMSWQSVPYATSYTLQQDTTSSFSNPLVIVQDNVLSYTFNNQPAGTYYYRVLASNASGNSPYSNVQTITITNVTPNPVPANGLEYSAWYIDWTSWFNGPPFVIPANVNMINVFVGELAYAADGSTTMDGFGNLSIPQLEALATYCKSQVPPIQVKVSIGGSGGMYDKTWDKLTASNVQSFAQGMVNFCHAHGLAGVDFDYEEFASSGQESLVGNLILAFKTLDPTLQTSLCTNAGFGPNYPWQQAVKNILDSAMIGPGNCALDRLYIMSYYDPMSSEIGWIVGPDGNGGWANWMISNYGFTRARISVGIDDYDANAYDPQAFKAWAIQQGFSYAHWAFDPAHPKNL